MLGNGLNISYQQIKQFGEHSMAMAKVVIFFFKFRFQCHTTNNVSDTLVYDPPFREERSYDVFKNN